MMSNRTFIVTWWQRMKELAAKDRRYILAGVTAPRDEDNEPSLRVLTSTKTMVPLGSRAMMSASPKRQRQLRSSISYPLRSRQRAAASSPRSPSERLSQSQALQR